MRVLLRRSDRKHDGFPLSKVEDIEVWPGKSVVDTPDMKEKLLVMLDLAENEGHPVFCPLLWDAERDLWVWDKDPYANTRQRFVELNEAMDTVIDRLSKLKERE